ncbi:hypothetical protein SAMN05444006_10356 [Allgaiera indica]|uniref:Uncharacterized protein n=1 Tax=Allgaiera indica TaxID=765699 RepID=A0A1H2T161_9RHOB|nr:hypothetical protein SAMN05444006_10356 [Allgaiera indica]
MVNFSEIFPLKALLLPSELSKLRPSGYARRPRVGVRELTGEGAK